MPLMLRTVCYAMAGVLALYYRSLRTASTLLRRGNISLCKFSRVTFSLAYSKSFCLCLALSTHFNCPLYLLVLIKCFLSFCLSLSLAWEAKSSTKVEDEPSPLIFMLVIYIKLV
jgi:hypothetical protein